MPHVAAEHIADRVRVLECREQTCRDAQPLPHERSVLPYTYHVMCRMTGFQQSDGLDEQNAYDAADNLIDAIRNTTAWGNPEVR